MEPESMLIKKEIGSTEDNNNEFSFDINVKVEATFEEGDWCIQNKDVILESVRMNLGTVHYTELIEDCFQTCFICYRFFDNSYSLLKHNLTHLKVSLADPDLFQCDNCLICFMEKQDLIEHISTEHEDKNHYGKVSESSRMCSICKKTFKYKHWHSHMREVHGQKSLKCKICNIEFKCDRYYNKHMATRHGIEKHPKKIQNLIVKAGEVQCTLCPAVLSNKSALTTHIRNCHSTKVYECHICKSKLKSQPYLYTHLRRVHYNDGKEHKCNECGKKFRSPRYLRVHKKNAHYYK